METMEMLALANCKKFACISVFYIVPYQYNFAILPGASAYTSDKKNPVAHDDLYEWRSGWIFNSLSVIL